MNRFAHSAARMNVTLPAVSFRLFLAALAILLLAGCGGPGSGGQAKPSPEEAQPAQDQKAEPAQVTEPGSDTPTCERYALSVNGLVCFLFSAHPAPQPLGGEVRHGLTGYPADHHKSARVAGFFCGFYPVVSSASDSNSCCRSSCCSAHMLA